jgi:UDP-glucose 4-epimerase
MSSRAHRPQGIVAAARKAVETGEALAVWGDGSAEKDYLHIDDFCEAMVTVINRGLTGCFNLCHGESHSVREVIDVIESLLGRPVPLEYVQRPPWDVVRSRVSGQKFRRATGWESSIPLRDGIARCFESDGMV